MIASASRWAAVWRGLVAALCAAGLLAAGCGKSAEPARSPGPARIVVSIAPLVGLVREIAPDAEVTLLVPPGVSEHGYELTPGDVAKVRRADLIVGVGLGLETRLEELVRSMDERTTRVLWFSSVLPPEERAAADEAEHDHDHGHDHGDHEHDDGHDHDDHAHAVDPHLWLDPVLVERFVGVLGPAIEDAIERSGEATDDESPRSMSVARANAATTSLRERIKEVDARARAAMAPLAGRAIVTHHASHGRFADRYGLRVAATIRLAETMEPTPGQVRAAVEAIRSEGVPAVFVEPQFDATTASRIAEESGVRVVTLDPMGDGDWFALMEHTIGTIAGALGGEIEAGQSETGQTPATVRPSGEAP